MSTTLAYYLHDLSPFIYEFANGVGLRWYGLAYVIAFLLGYMLFHWLAKHRYTAMQPQQAADFITWAAIFGVMLGGRIGWIIFYGWHEFLQDPGIAYRVWEGGMSSHGGILGLVFYTLYYARTRRISWTSIGDSLVVAAPIGIFVVRCANLINGELWGKPAHVPWAVQFPTELLVNETLKAHAGLRMSTDEILERVRAHDPDVVAALRDVLPPRHPSQIYEALLEGAALFAVLWFLRVRCRLPRGVVTGAFFIFYAAFRIVGEVFRHPDEWVYGRLSAGQFLSLFLFIIGVAFVWWGFRCGEYEEALRRRPRRTGESGGGGVAPQTGDLPAIDEINAKP